jgi:hypothetical protein
MLLTIPSKIPYTAVVELVEGDEWEVGSDWNPNTTGLAANIATISNADK